MTLNNAFMLRSLILPLSILVAVPAVLASSSGAQLISPIKHLGPSLAACQAQGTLVAVATADRNAVIVLTRLPRSNDEEYSISIKEPTPVGTEVWGIQVLDRDLTDETAAHHPITRLGPSAVMGMTGFLPDVLHLKRLSSQSVETLFSIYNKPPAASKVVQVISSRLDRAARVEGSRPFGVQVLLVSSDEKRNELSLVTIEPTGGWRNHQLEGAAVVGRFAEGVRSQLMKTPQKVNDAQDALHVAMKAVLQGGSEALNHNKDNNEDDKTTAIYEGMIVYTDDATRGCTTAWIHPDTVQKCRKDCLREISAEGKNTGL